MKSLKFFFELGGPLIFALLLGIQLFGGSSETPSTETSSPGALPEATTSPTPVAVPEASPTLPPAVLPEVTSTSTPSILSKIFSTSAYTFPVSGYGTDAIISGFGDPRGKTRKHLGVDIKAPRHTEVVAIRAGKIERVKKNGNGGKTIYLRGDDDRLYFYAHLEDWTVKEGDLVDQGDAIATVGDSGNAKGTTPHLHFEIMVGKGKARKSIDPRGVLD